MFENYTLVRSDGRNPLSCTVRRIGTVDAHAHDSFELDMVISGNCRLRVGERTFLLNPEDVVSIDAHTPHSLAGNDCSVVVIHFDQSFFERTLPVPTHPEFVCNSSLQGDSAAFGSLRKLIARLVKNNSDRALGYELRNWSLIYDIMDVMYQNFRVENSEARNQRAHRYSVRMAELSKIIGEHYQEDLSLNSLALQVHLSAPYLSKFFEKQFGMTFLSYLTRVRLEHAVTELMKSDDTIETISANSGFPNSHAFVQAFKKEYGILPSLYRRQQRQEKPKPKLLQPEQHDYVAGLSKYLDSSNELTKEIPAISCRIQFDVNSARGTLRHTWKNMLTAPSATSLLSSDIQLIINRIQREIGFSYIKFNGILSEEMHVYSEDASGNAVYSFTYVDKVLDYLQSVGLRPLLQLSFMPEQLAKERKRLFGYLVSEPKDNEKWADLVRALIRHILIRYGKEEVRSWLFSIWEQPDTPANLYGFSNDEAFYRFYEVTYRAITELDSQLRIGSPATYYILQKNYTNWYLLFWDWCRAHNCVPDFLSIHYYDTVFTSEQRSSRTFGFPTLTYDKDPENGSFPTGIALREEIGFSGFVSQIRQERSRYLPKEPPIYLTEWNNSPSQQDLLNDTCYKSCYIVKCILENYDRLDSFAYWSLTDWMGEAPQPPEQFHGGLGMFTSYGIPKAAYYAFTLLGKLGDVFLGKGPGWFATKRQNGDIAILLYHYKHYSYLYAKGERFNMTFKDRYTIFDPEQPLDVHLHLDSSEAREYLVKETVLNRSSGSSFDLWVNSGAEELRDRGELNILEQRSVPGFQKYRAFAENHVLRIDVMLELLEVRLIEISPYTEI